LFGAELSAEGESNIDRPSFSLSRAQNFFDLLFCFAMAKKSAKKASTLLLQQISFENLAFNVLSDRLDARSMRHVSRIVRDLSPGSLRNQVWALSTLLRFDLGVYIADVELSAIFHYMGSWATSVIADHKSSLFHSTPVGPRRPNLVKSGSEQELAQFCLVRQRERVPVTISDVTDHLAQRSITVDRSWVAHSVERYNTELMV
jgi:hypothetical protein